jgi:hypothetical protein
MMKTRALLVGLLVMVLASVLPACRCNGPEDGAGDATPEEPTTGEEPATDEAATADGAEAATIPVSPEVATLIEAGDVAALAADMQARAARVRELSASTEQRSQSLEQVAEGMTGRSTTIDPADPGAQQQLAQSADQIASGAAEMATDVAALRQLVVDLQAEAEAIYGAPASPGS